MLHGSPSQLLPTALLPTVLALARPGELLGAWVRGCRRLLRLRTDRRSILAGSDLGALLRRCNRIAVRNGSRPAVVEAECLIAWRTLRIVTGSPYLPRLDRLRSLVPELQALGSHIVVPIGLGAPEEALAACVEAGVPVVASWIEYRG